MTNKTLLEVGKYYKTNIDFDVYLNHSGDCSFSETLDEHPFLILEKTPVRINWFWFKILFNGKIRYICQKEKMIAETFKI